MKRNIYLLLFMLVPYSLLKAQISISSSDLQPRLAVGKKIITYLDNSSKTINIGSKNNFGTLDFSGLKKASEYLTEGVSSSPYASTYNGAQFISKNNQQSNGVAATNYIYTTISSDSYLLYGVATEASVSGIATVTKIKYNPTQLVYKLPLTLNSSNTHQSSQELESVVFGISTKLTNSYKNSYTVDGYGKIKTPEGKTVDALRIKLETTITTSTNTTTVSTSYGFIAKTGEFVSVPVKANQPDNGIVEVESIAWNDGDGTSNPTSIGNLNEIPSEYSLSQNYPNPFNPSTTIKYSIHNGGFVSLKVYDMLGKEVATLVNEYKSAGNYTSSFSTLGTSLSSGLYVYKLQTNNFTQSKKMILIK